MTEQDRIFRAKILGTVAFRAGKPCAPALDQNLVEMLDPEVGSNVEILKAWIRGWTFANLREETKMKFNDVRGNHHVRRALEVAAAGGHTIAFTGEGQVGNFERLAKSLGVTVGNHADITVEVPPIKEGNPWGIGEPHERIVERIEACRKDNSDLPMEELANTLLNAATKYYSLSDVRVCQTVDVAVTVANLAGAKSVCAAYMAEAIQYVPFELDFCSRQTSKV